VLDDFAKFLGGDLKHRFVPDRPRRNDQNIEAAEGCFATLDEGRRCLSGIVQALGGPASTAKLAPTSRSASTTAGPTPSAAPTTATFIPLNSPFSVNVMGNVMGSVMELARFLPAPQQLHCPLICVQYTISVLLFAWTNKSGAAPVSLFCGGR
jgi:hypothetical protein